MPRGDPATTPTFHLFDVTSVTEAETHFQNTKIVDAEKTQEPATGRWKPLDKTFAFVVHLPACACARHPESGPREHFQRTTVSQSSSDPQIGVAAQPTGQ